MPTLESVVDASNFALFCTPAVNLFPKRADRIHVSRQRATSTTSCRIARGRWTSRSTRSPASSATASAPTASSSSCRSTRPTAPTASSSRPAYFTTRREPRLVSAAQKRRGPRSSYIGTEVFLVARRSGAGAVQRRPAAAVGPDAVHQPRSRAADAGGRRRERLHARRRRAGGEHPRGERAEPAVRAAGRRRRGVARDQPSVAQLPVAGRSDAARRAPRRCASCSSCTRRAADASARRQIEGIRSVRVGRVVRRLPRAGPIAFGRGLEITLQRRRAGVRGRQRVPARRGARALLRAARVDQLVHRNRAAVGEPGRNQPMGAAVGRETDALAFFAALAEAPYRLRLLPDAAAARVPVRRQAALGTRRCGRSTSRCGSDRIPDLSFAPAPLASFERRDGGGRRGCRCGCSACSGPNGPLPLHLTEYARERLRHAGDPTLSRFLDLFHHRFLALFYRAWAQAQPHVNRDRPDDDRFAVYVGAFVGMAPAAFRDRDALPDLAKFFHVGALIRQVRNAEGLAPILAALLPRAGADRGVRRPLDAPGRRRADRTSAREGAQLGVGRRARRPGVGPAAQVPDPARAADARAVRELPARRRSAPASWSTGCGCISASSSTGMCACC